MKTVIFAGGVGSRIFEESVLRPKPMIGIGGRPILWHIMKIYSHYGYHDFVICLGYKGEMIREYFLDYFMANSDLTVDIENNDVQIHHTNREKFRVTLIDTGALTNTAGRLRRVREYVDGETFMLTYGDGVADVDIGKLVECHRSSGKLATVTAVQPPGRFGSVSAGEDGVVTNFEEKPDGDGAWINGGFFVLEPDVFKYLEGDMDDVQWEHGPLAKITQDGQLAAYFHRGFWKSMDAIRDKVELEALWKSNQAKWKIWQD